MKRAFFRSRFLLRYIAAALAILRRMVSYIPQAHPRTEELLVDEMMAICAEIETWRQKKESQEAQERYNSWLYYKKWNPDEEE